ncbi:putative leucine-rich repeat domain, L domain-containing protein [Medicago truncatula]|uniref:Putative leucine-rich repeat domain, L domain-containing protein n=1 Tax=Medicago truncatula TaxID=3880 RepID=A0A396HXH1_MEDTR|nr:F-box/LRR-repeat protein 2 [Medicago truncatula]RHN58009.1 putative leucine-rich repeat domain, L domain-containing protein [Medicago truncatula]
MKRKRASLRQLAASLKTTMESTQSKTKITMESSNAKKRRKSISSGSYLPDECWECVFKFLKDDNHYLKSLSLVSKQFLSITNTLRFSLTICDQTLPFLPTLFHRFTNLTSLNLSRFYGNLNKLLCQISHFPLKLTSLKLSDQSVIPAFGFRAFSKKITTLTSLTCYEMHYINSSDLLLISDCFPLLEVLDLRYPTQCNYDELEELALFKLRKVNLSGHYHVDKLIFQLFKNCKFLEEAILLTCFDTTFDGLASALRQRPTLRSLSFSNTFGPVDQTYESTYITSHFRSTLASFKYLTSLDLLSSNISDVFLISIAIQGLPLTRLVLQNCTGYSYSGIICLLSKCQHLKHLDLENAVFLKDEHVVEMSSFLGDLVSINLASCPMVTVSAFFVLLRNCPSLGDINMEDTGIGKESLESSRSLMNFVAYPQLKYLRLAHNPWLFDEDITMFASIFPNLQLLDLSNCCRIFEEGIVQVLRMCCNIRHLNLSKCSIVRLEIDFEVPKLEVLNLSYTKVDDEALYMISKSCCGLLKLSLQDCNDVTKKGVKHVVENCTQLRKISLNGCFKVHANVVSLMVFSRPSLRRIRAPPAPMGAFSGRKVNYFLRHGCLVR